MASDTESITSRAPLVGVLAIQGDYEAHAKRLRELGAEVRLVRLPADLDELDGLIIPGGESTTFLKFLERDGFASSLKSFAANHPTMGTCAGCILLAENVTHPAQDSLGVLDVTVERNAYGRQNDSAVMTGATSLDGGPLEMVFIRAPRITRTGKGVTVLAERENSPVLVRQGDLLAATFHPELSDDPRVHQMFLDIVRDRMKQSAA
jgi:pyridoxal 5'-phosphate synthase pdxT subunit